MNQGRIWTVVSPNVGLPLFLGSVALMSFTIHFAVLGSTTWMTDFYNGHLNKPMAAAETAVVPNADLAAAKSQELAIEVAQAPAIVGDDSMSIVLKIKPKTAAPDPS